MRRILLAVFLAVGLVLTFLLTGHAQPLSVLQGKVLTGEGKPVTNQPLVIEGLKDSGWNVFSWFRPFRPDEKWAKEIHVVSVTDQQGAFQIVNLPAGYHTIKLLRAGAMPIVVKDFKLARGYEKTEVAGVVSAELLGRQIP